jgi:Domain of unknown function (DUF4338)
MSSTWHLLPVPATWPEAEKRAFASLARVFSSPPVDGHAAEVAVDACQRRDQPGLGAAAHVLADLFRQGWAVRVDDGQILVSPPEAGTDPGQEKERIRRQELLKRDEQLLVPSVRSFVASMERPREFHGRFVSIFSLMRDGRELKAALEDLASQRQEDPSVLRTVIDPYVQVVSTGERCRHTGLRLTDVWRYFRHTWTNQYTSTPGRSMLILVRDRAGPYHPVIGIAALSSAVVQISERDNWIGWQPKIFLADLAANPTVAMARWVVRRLEDSLSELYLDDLLQDGLYWPSLWDSPSGEVIERLTKEAESRRRDHHRFARQSDFKKRTGADDPELWRQRARSDLFRSKRCLALAELLRARAALSAFLYPTPSSDGLKCALNSAEGRRAIAGILRRAKAESVGTEIADLTVCGAVAPYSVLLGGKLVCMLSVSPSVVRAYRDKYSGYAGEIASAMAGRPVQRRTNLVFIGTTSLYGSGSSQYNRVRVPAEILGGRGSIDFLQLGRSRSFGTSHLSAQSVSALVRLAEQSRTGVRVNSIFGEGVNPKLRKVRYGLDLLGWPSDQLLQHGRQRIVYGASLVRNLLPYLLDVDTRPDYVFPLKIGDDVAAISEWWFQRWLSRRVGSPAVMEAVGEHQLDRPVRHGARVILPRLPPAGQLSFWYPADST